MIIDNPVIRIVLRAISACGLIDNQDDAAGSRSNPAEQRESPFVLVARAPDGKWGVFERDFEKPLAAFDELQDACIHASELSKTRVDSMVLIGRRPDSAARRDTSMAQGTI